MPIFAVCVSSLLSLACCAVDYRAVHGVRNATLLLLPDGVNFGKAVVDRYHSLAIRPICRGGTRWPASIPKVSYGGLPALWGWAIGRKNRGWWYYRRH